MSGTISLPEQVQRRLCCPVCKAAVEQVEDGLKCTQSSCGAHFPVEDGIPVLINESNSIFLKSDFVRHKDTFFTPRRKLDTVIDRMLPRLTFNLKGRRNYAKLAELLRERSERPNVLVLGGSILGEGMDALVDSPGIATIDTDVSFGPRTQLICDAHDIPFADASFDAVVAQAVLEHVADPYRCVQEIHRVLKPDGYVYVEIPFMFPVHGRQYDFTRFTHMGLRRLLRGFSEVDSGSQAGPGQVLAVSWQWFLWSFTDRRLPRKLLKVTARLTGWFWKYFDRYLVNVDAALDCASGCFFLGTKSNNEQADRDLIKTYRGGIPL